MGSEDVYPFIKNRGSEQMRRSRVSRWRGTSQSREMGAGLQFNCGSGLEFSPSPET